MAFPVWPDQNAAQLQRANWWRAVTGNGQPLLARFSPFAPFGAVFSGGEEEGK